eukprot:4387672-Lingulodinium_polyedra.AAC.1
MFGRAVLSSSSMASSTVHPVSCVRRPVSSASGRRGVVFVRDIPLADARLSQSVGLDGVAWSWEVSIQRPA